MSNAYTVGQVLDRLRENWLEETSPETDVVFAIIRLNDIIRQKTDKLLKKHGLTPAAFEVLVALRSVPEPRQLTPTELYNSVLMSSGGMTKVLIGLETHGFIARLSNPDDGRSSLVRLTIAGGQKVEHVMSVIVKLDRLHFAGILTDNEIQQLREIALNSVAKIEAAK